MSMRQRVGRQEIEQFLIQVSRTEIVEQTVRDRRGL